MFPPSCHFPPQFIQLDVFSNFRSQARQAKFFAVFALLGISFFSIMDTGSEQAVWLAAVAPDGRTYYYNSTTNVTQWTKPEALMSPAEASDYLSEISQLLT
jgi:hypothetical protein